MPDPTARLNEALADRYRIERKIGEGGMASVYLADDLKHERQVALKILRPELAAVIGAERFLAEIKTTANLQHPHILPLFDSGEADGFLYYVMPYIAEENLRDRIEREGQLGVDEAVKIARNVGEALDYAHRNDIIHRDIKPANILLHDGNPLVADFGIALAVSAAGGGRMTETGLSLGTPHYMSPEQASAERDLSARSDVYSLGCVVYEVLAGHPPHTGPNAQSVLVRILTEDPRPVSEVRRSVPPNVAAAVTKAIEKLPADRFESARAFVDALGDPGFTYVAAARTATAPGTSSSATPARRRSPLAAGLPWALAVVFAALAGWSMLRAPEPTPVTTSPTDLQGREPAGAFGLDFTVAPDGSAFALGFLVDGEPRIAVRRSSDRDYRMLAGTGIAIGPTLSPPGDWVAYWGRGQGLMKVPTAGGDPQPVVPNQSIIFPLLPLDWADDGSILFVDASRNPDEVRIVPNTGGESRIVYDDGAYSGQILPGGNVVLGVASPDKPDPGVWFIDMERDTSWVVVPEGIHPRYANGHLLWADDSGTVRAAGFDPATGVLDEDHSIVVERVTTFQNRWARYDVSENGTLVYSTGGSSERNAQFNRRLLTVTLDGTVIEEALDPRFIQYPVWSPGGRYVAYHGAEPGAEPGAESDDSGLFIYDMQVKDRPRRLTRERIGYGMAWSPDESRIAFGARGEDSQALDIYVKDRDGSAPATLLFGGEDYQVPADWFSEEQMLITNRTEPWILNLPAEGTTDTADGQPFFQSEDFTLGLKVGPRREWVTYSSNRTGQSEVYLRSFPNPGAPLTISEDGGQYPHWSADENVIFYFRSQNGSVHLWAARIDRGPPLTVLGNDSLAAWPDGVPFNEADLHPDGDRFIGYRLAEETGDAGDAAEEVRYFIVTNWFEEMRERLAGGG